MSIQLQIELCFSSRPTCNASFSKPESAVFRNLDKFFLSFVGRVTSLAAELIANRFKIHKLLRWILREVAVKLLKYLFKVISYLFRDVYMRGRFEVFAKQWK